jgi:signal transduction histidine kinase
MSYMMPFLLWILFFTSSAHAATPPLFTVLHNPADTFLSEVEALLPTQTLTWEQAQQQPEHAWKKYHQPLHFGISPHPVWLRFQVQGPPDQQVYLWMDRVNMDRVCVYHQRGSQCQYAQAPEPRLADLRLPLGIVPTPRTVYLEVQTANLLILPVHLVTDQQLFTIILNKYLWEGLLIGLYLTLFAYHLLHAIYLHSLNDLYYCLINISGLIYFGGFLLGYGRLFAEWSSIVHDYAYGWLNLLSLSALAGGAHLFHIRKNSPRLYQSMVLLAGAHVAISPIMLWGPRTWAVAWVNVSSPLYPTLVMLIILSALKNQFKGVGIYLFGWLQFQCCLLVSALAISNILPFFPFALKLPFWSMGLLLILMSFSLANRIKGLQMEREMLQIRNLNLVISHKNQLERTVQQRTEALEQTMQALGASNNAKDRLFSIIAHDLRSPFSSLASLLKQIEKNIHQRNILQQMVPRIKQQIDSIYNTLDNLLAWAHQQMQESVTQPQTFDVVPLLQETTHLYSAMAEQKSIDLHLDSPEQLYLHADPDQLRIILRNLLNNALKYTPPQGQIDLKAQLLDKTVEIQVSDTGWGMRPHQVEAIRQGNFQSPPIQAGTLGERGVGLGLQLCQNYILQNEGSLFCESIEGQGTTFTVYLPNTSEHNG